MAVRVCSPPVQRLTFTAERGTPSAERRTSNVQPRPLPPTRPSQLIRGLSAVDATGLVVGVVIGTGVFLKGAIITQLVGTPALALGAWVAAGLLSLAGALTYAELGAMLPETGGEYVFLRAAYGRAVAFQYGWMRVIVGGSTMAAVATSFATFFGSLVNLGGDWLAVDRQVTGHAIHWAIGARQLVALVVIGAVAIINSIGVKASGRTQTVLAVIKVSAVVLIIVGVFTMSTTGDWTHFRETASRLPAVASGLSRPAAFGAAVVGAMWAYTGWSYLPISAGEIQNPQRTLPLAIIGGTLVVMTLYIGVNAAYFYALSPSAIITANSTIYPTAPAVATKAVATFLGGNAGKAVTAIFMISALGTLNASMLYTPRVPFAMARDGQFFSIFGVLGRRSHVPVFGIVAVVILRDRPRGEWDLRPAHRLRRLRVRHSSSCSRRWDCSCFAARCRMLSDHTAHSDIHGCRSRSP